MMSHSMVDNKKDNSFNLLRPTRSADMRVSAKHDSHLDSESTENFSYIMPTT